MKFSYALILIMALLLIIVCIFIFVAPKSHAQDLFDRAEIEFDIDYIDIDKVKILGSKNKGKIIAVWMKSGSVLTKTLSKSKIKFSDDREFDNGEDYNERTEERDESNIWNMTTDELIVEANRILSSQWINKSDALGSGYHEEMDLLKILHYLKLSNNKGPEFVRLAMDIIAADLKRGSKIGTMSGELDALEYFAEGDEQLTKMANDFLEENGFNKEN